jgi:hypothetical protein
MWHVDPLSGNVRNTHAASNIGAMFSVVRARTVAMERAQLMRALWRHTTIEKVMQVVAFCRFTARLCSCQEIIKEREGRLSQSSSRHQPARIWDWEQRNLIEESRHLDCWVQVSSDLKVSLWKEDLAYDLKTLCGLWYSDIWSVTVIVPVLKSVGRKRIVKTL